MDICMIKKLVILILALATGETLAQFIPVTQNGNVLGNCTAGAAAPRACTNLPAGIGGSGRIYTNLSATTAPTSTCNWGSITTAFTCDLTNIGIAIGISS